jgi:hypothetical protein
MVQDDIMYTACRAFINRLSESAGYAIGSTTGTDNSAHSRCRCHTLTFTTG